MCQLKHILGPADQRDYASTIEFVQFSLFSEGKMASNDEHISFRFWDLKKSKLIRYTELQSCVAALAAAWIIYCWIHQDYY